MLFLRTVSGFQLRQIVNRVARKVLRPVRVPGKLIPTAPRFRTGRSDARPSFLPRPPSYSPPDAFRFLNESRPVDAREFGSRKGTLLWDYNFHYFDGLLAEAPGEREKRDWVARWIDNVSVGCQPAWDPYPISRRIGNWIKWALTASERVSEDFHRSLATQALALEGTLEYHLMANHLLANGIALAQVGAYFSGPDAERWLARGLQILDVQLDEQFLPDGGHFELSPAYHALILEDLFDLIQVLRGQGLRVPTEITEAAVRALGWLRCMQRPDGEIPLFNDASYDMARSPDELLEYGRRLGIDTGADPDSGLSLMRESGYFRYSEGRLTVFGDVGQIGPRYQPGHAHCDMLSFELAWDGVPIVVDTGTSTYEVGARRNTERGTRAHNTVQVGSHEQSEIWGGFRVARRARPLEVGVVADRISATIRAFPAAWSELSREWHFRGESVEVRDRAIAGVAHSTPLVARLHIHPDVPLERQGETFQVGDLLISFEGADVVREVEYEYAPEFNRRVPGRCLEVGFTHDLITRITPVA